MTANWKEIIKIEFICPSVKSHVPFSSILSGKNILQASSYTTVIIYKTRILGPSEEIASLRFCFKQMEGKKVLLLLPSPQPCPDGWCCSWVEEL